MADKESIMTTVMKLLDRANHPETPPAEAEACRERAERLMEQHMIDRMDLKPEEKSKIAVEEWDINVGELGSQQSWEYFHTMVSLMDSVLRHTGCKVNPSYDYKKVVDDSGRERKDHKIRVFKVVGFPEDLAYADRIWFRVYKEFITNINPTWQPGRDNLGENCHNMLNAGLKWGDIWRMAYRYQEQMRETNPHWCYLTPKGAQRIIPDPRTNKYAPMLKAAVKEYLAAQGKQYQAHTQRHEVYRTSFARSFNGTLANRLRKMRDEARAAKDGEAGIDKDRFALALRTTEEQVTDEFYRLFPEYDPELRRKQKEADAFQAWIEAVDAWNAMTPEEQEETIKASTAEWERKQKEEAAEEARWQRRAARARNNYGALRNDPNRIDESAWERGRQAAAKVDLSNNAEVSKPSTKELR